jgi:hypothetical protein
MNEMPGQARHDEMKSEAEWVVSGEATFFRERDGYQSDAQR